MKNFNLKTSDINGAFLIEASAGTGKTYSLTRIVLRLLMETDIKINQVLMVTFTKAAAGELKARLRNLLLEVKEAIAEPDNVNFADELLYELYQQWDADTVRQRVDDAIEGLDDCCVSTIHSFCQKMLKEHRFSGQKSGNYELADDADDILTRVVDDFLRKELQNAGDSLLKDILAQSDPADVLYSILKKYLALPAHSSYQYYTDWFVGKYGEVSEEDLKNRKCDSEEVVEFLKRFLAWAPNQVQQMKNAQGICTFDDLIVGLEKELTPQFSKIIGDQFKAVLIDEFQDTDPTQYNIFKTLFLKATQDDPSRSLIFVGDPKQSIYRFRGADIDTYKKARKDIGKTLNLGRNFRSNAVLLDTINTYFADDGSDYTFGNEDITYTAVTAGSPKLPLYRDINGQKSVLPVLEIWSRDDNKNSLGADDQREQEAQLIANDIYTLLNTNVMIKEGQRLSAKDIVILVRTWKNSEPIIRALNKKKIRCITFEENDVFQTEEADDILRILMAMEIPQDNKRQKLARLTRIMAEHINDVSPEVFQNAPNSSILEKKALEARELIDQARSLFDRKGVASAFALLFEKCQTEKHLLPLSGGEKRLNNYRHIIELLQEQARHLTTLSGLTRWYVKAREQSGGEKRKIRVESDENLVTIMTIHGSKGLEYPVVYLPGAWNGNHKRSSKDHLCQNIIQSTGETQLTISFSTQSMNEVDEDIEENNALEGLRLAYVAMTRASQRLVLPLMLRQKANKGDFNGPFFRALTKNVQAKGNVDLVVEAKTAYLEKVTNNLANHPEMTQTIEEGLGVSHIEPHDLIKNYDVPIDIEKFDHHIEYGGDEINEDESLSVAPSRDIHSDWHQSSYSAIIRGAHEQFDLTNQAEKEDQIDEVESEKPNVVTPLPENDILNFSRGAESGTFLHAIFERIDFDLVRRAQFEDDTEADEKLLSRADVIARPYAHNFQNLNKEMLRQLMKDVLCCSIFKDDDGNDFNLCKIDSKQREMTFTMAINAPMKGRKAVTVETLSELLKTFEKKYHLPDMTPKALKGFLTGAIDMVFTHKGQFFVLDWKSNFLGENIDDYRMPAMKKAMADHHYYLQYLIYCVALKRFLKSRGIELTDENFGGVIYAFIRGMRINNKQPYGIYFEKPSLALIECLDDFFMNGFDARTVGHYADQAEKGN